MNLYQYNVWFRDHDCIPSDQDYEWVACFLVKANSRENARAWGDIISESYSARNPSNEFLNSKIELAEDNKLPIVEIGIKPSDQYIGW